ncbi:MAG: tyrosine-type recombinase/integrase [Dehalococcoidia bacterium]
MSNTSPIEPGFDPQPIALTRFTRMFNAQLRSEQKSPRTIQAYEYTFTRFARWFETIEGREPLFGDFTVGRVRMFLSDTMDVPKWAGHRYIPQGQPDQKISSATLHQYARNLKTFGLWFEREGYVDRNPLYALRMPRLTRRELVPLTEDEQRVLLKTYSDTIPTECRLRAIFLLLLDTGLRLAELTGLQDRNVDLDAGYVRVLGKGRKERSVPFGHLTEKVLRKYAEFFRPDPASPLVTTFFLSPDGYPMTPKAVTMLFQRARSRTGIARLHPHLLRHTYAIRAQEQDMPTITLQHYMGHSSPEMTERYVHAAQSERLKRARGHSPIDQFAARDRELIQGTTPPRKRRR